MIFAPFAIAVVGLLVWALASNPKVAEAGRILFFCGAFVLTQGLAHDHLKLWP